MVLTDILRELFISELDQLRMVQNLKSWPLLNIFLATSLPPTSDSAKNHSLRVFWQDRCWVNLIQLNGAKKFKIIICCHNEQINYLRRNIFSIIGKINKQGCGLARKGDVPFVVMDFTATRHEPYKEKFVPILKSLKM